MIKNKKIKYVQLIANFKHNLTGNSFTWPKTHPTAEVASRLNIRRLTADRVTPLRMCLIDEDISNEWTSSEGWKLVETSYCYQTHLG